MLKAKPELPYLTLSELAKAWECSEDDILHRGIAGQLKICVLSAGWDLQEGYYIDEGPHIPIKERLDSTEILQLRRNALREILSYGEATDPEFFLEADDVPDQVEDGEKYERFLSSVIIPPQGKTAARENPKSKIIVRKSDLFIRKEDVEIFPTENNDQATKESKIYDLSTMKKEDRETLVLEYAVRIWEEYQKEHLGKPPRISYVHNQIEKNKNFMRTGKSKAGEFMPSYKTITKEITEERIIKIVQSRKNADKRA